MKSGKASEALTEAFEALHTRAKSLYAIVAEEGKDGNFRAAEELDSQFPVRVLAGTVEQTPEFKRLTMELFEVSPLAKGELKTDWHKLYEWREARDTLRELLRRSGYYHALIAGEPPEPYWERVAARAKHSCWDGPYTLLMLGRIRFPEISSSDFEIAGWRLLPLSEIEIDLGPPEKVCADFYPEEWIESTCNRWVLADPSFDPKATPGMLQECFELEEEKNRPERDRLLAELDARQPAPKGDHLRVIVSDPPKQR